MVLTVTSTRIPLFSSSELYGHDRINNVTDIRYRLIKCFNNIRLRIRLRIRPSIEKQPA